MKRYFQKSISILLLICLFMTETFSIKSPFIKMGNNEPIKIMCVGDSITDGYGIPGSYRKFLYHGLTQKGYNIDMIALNQEGLQNIQMKQLEKAGNMMMIIPAIVHIQLNHIEEEMVFMRLYRRQIASLKSLI